MAQKESVLQVATPAAVLAAYKLACLSQGTDMTAVTNTHMVEYIRKYAPPGPVRDAALGEKPKPRKG